MTKGNIQENCKHSYVNCENEEIVYLEENLCIFTVRLTKQKKINELDEIWTAFLCVFLFFFVKMITLNECCRKIGRSQAQEID